MQRASRGETPCALHRGLPPVAHASCKIAHAEDGECADSAECEASGGDDRFLHGNSFEMSGLIYNNTT